jgi:hypothetical protein
MDNIFRIGFKRVFTRSAIKISLLFYLLLVLMSIVSCRLPLYTSFLHESYPVSSIEAGERIEITEDTFTIAWDPDPSSGIPDSYRMYFRSRGDEPWSLLSELVPNIEPEFTITQDNLSYGIYEFAVSSVKAGIESDLHTSMDDTANPGTGWFLDWHSL